jgi:hypothetical protein
MFILSSLIYHLFSNLMETKNTPKGMFSKTLYLPLFGLELAPSLARVAAGSLSQTSHRTLDNV